MFRIDANELKRILGLLGKFVASRVGVPILSCVHIHWGGNAIEFTATDLDSWLAMFMLLPEGLDTHGEVCLPHKTLANLAAAMEGEVEFQQGQAQVLLMSGGARFALPVYPADQYPERPTAGEDIGSMEATVLKEALHRVASCCSGDVSRPALTAVYWDGGTMVATDGTRLATAEVPDVGRSILLAGKTMVAVAGMLPEEGTVHLSSAKGAADNLVRFRWQDGKRGYQVTVRQLAAPFPEWRNILPKSDPVVQAKVSRDQMLSALRRMSAVAGSEWPVVHLAIGEGGVRLSAGGSSGEGEEMIAGEVVGELKLRADIGIVRDGLQLAGSERVRLSGWGSEQIQRVSELGNERWVYYWLPLRGGN